MDLLDQPEVVKPVLHEVNAAWLRYWQASIGVIHQWVGGYLHWFCTWSDRPSTDLQCDFSILISPDMFEEFFLPELEQQTQWVERTLYHLDGPGAVRHLDALLSLPRLTGIQWIPGAGAPPPSKWIPVLRRIQAKGKLVWLFCEPWEVEVLMAELEPEGLLMCTQCESEEEAKELIGNVAHWTKRRQWVVA
jgi:5-methyltetrahydrofolate--homocysteine methyltransferase